MKKAKRILIADDDKNTIKFLRNVLMSKGYKVFSCSDGKEAEEILNKFDIDIIITDWLMPKSDGLHLIKYVRNNLQVQPIILMLTALSSERSHQLALESGADEFLSKPIESNQLLETVDIMIARSEQADGINSDIQIEEQNVLPPFVGVVIAASTGGPPVLIDVFKKIPPTRNAVFYVVQHGPAWMFESFVKRLQQETKMQVKVAIDGEASKPGTIYLAPGDIHLVVDKHYNTHLWDGPKENFIKPAADPLFRSAAKMFGRYCIGAILTGLGRDGTDGAAHVVAAKGKLIIQNPMNSAAPSMPTSAVKSKVRHVLAEPHEIGGLIHTYIYSLASKLVSDKK
jgi:two-component system, chemotaxis family, protein-glutamate methylesterase/glutaminase